MEYKSKAKLLYSEVLRYQEQCSGFKQKKNHYQTTEIIEVYYYRL